MRTGFIAWAALCPLLAHASYELLLVADRGNGTAGSSRVHRIDGTTGAYFGSFGGGFLDKAIGVAVDGSTGTAYVSESGGAIQAFNYSTGLYMGQIGGPVFGDRYAIKVGDSIFGSGFSMLRTSLSTGVNTFINLPGSESCLWVAPVSSNEVLAMGFKGSTGNVLYKYNTTTNTFKTLSGTFNWGSSGFFVGATRLSNYQDTGPVYVSGLGPNGDIQVHRLDAGATSITSATTLSSTYVDNCYGVAPAHAGFFASGTLTSDTTHGGIAFFDNYGRERLGFTYSNMYVPRGIATVLAPEPGSIAAIAGGLLLMLGRRRKAKA